MRGAHQLHKTSFPGFVPGLKAAPVTLPYTCFVLILPITFIKIQPSQALHLLMRVLKIGEEPDQRISFSDS